jgi:plastocyanin
LRKRYLPLVAVLGAALAVIPAMATTSTPPSTATVSGLESIMWSPMEVAVTPGGTVTFQNSSSNVPHGVVWKSGPETPVCNGVPIDEGKTNWTGSCTFSREGTYEYYCYVHGMRMAGKIYVNPNGAVPTTTTTTPTTTTTTPTTTTTTPTTTTPTTPSTTQTTPTTPPPTTTSTTPTQTTGTTSTSQATTASSVETGTSQPGTDGGSPVHGGIPRDSLQGGSIRLLASQQGSTVHGSVQIAETGSHLEIELLAPSASIASRATAAVVIGRLVKANVHAGRFPFNLAPTGRAKHALARRGRLALTVKIILVPPRASKLTRTVTVTLHR